MTSRDLYRRAMNLYSKGDLNSAIDLLNAAAEMGDRDAIYCLAFWHKDGEVVAKDEDAARGYFSKFREIAEGGDAEAQFDLSELIRWGNGFEQDTELANQWLRKAASGGCAAAQVRLSEHLQHGIEGFTKDLPSAMEWAERAARQEHGGGLMQLVLLKRLAGAQEAELLELTQRAAAVGSVHAREALGLE